MKTYAVMESSASSIYIYAMVLITVQFWLSSGALDQLQIRSQIRCQIRCHTITELFRKFFAWHPKVSQRSVKGQGITQKAGQQTSGKTGEKAADVAVDCGA